MEEPVPLGSGTSCYLQSRDLFLWPPSVHLEATGLGWVSVNPPDCQHKSISQMYLALNAHEPIAAPSSCWMNYFSACFLRDLNASLRKELGIFTFLNWFHFSQCLFKIEFSHAWIYTGKWFRVLRIPDPQRSMSPMYNDIWGFSDDLCKNCSVL